MLTIVRYSTEFEDGELKLLRNFEPSIQELWLTNAASTLNFAWTLLINDEEPRRIAILSTNNAHELHRESLFSLEGKKIEVAINEFRKLFVEKAIAYFPSQ